MGAACVCACLWSELVFFYSLYYISSERLYGLAVKMAIFVFLYEFMNSPFATFFVEPPYGAPSYEFQSTFVGTECIWICDFVIDCECAKELAECICLFFRREYFQVCLETFLERFMSVIEVCG